METVRSFIAIDPDPPARLWLESWVDALSERFPKMRWVGPRNLHMTLKFLGDVPLEKIDGIAGICSQVAREIPAMRLEIGSPGSFGPRKAPRTFWLGILPGPGLDLLKEAQRRLEKALAKEGFPVEGRPWSPHITLGRNPRNLGADGWSELLPPWTGEDTPGFQVEGLYLFSSQLTRQGPIYRLLSTSPFIGGNPSPDHFEEAHP